MENIGGKLMIKIKELTELENASLNISIAIYLRNVKDKIKLATEEISKSINNQIKFYGQKEENYVEYKKEILDKYNQEFERLLNEYKIQYINIVEEIAEVQANQKILITNCNTIKNTKEKFINSEEYKKYVKLKQKYKDDMENSLTKIEFDKNLKKYQELKNPVKEYDKKIKENIEKVKNLEEVINLGKNKLDECVQKTLDEIDNLVSRKTKPIQVFENVNIFSKILNKITNLFSGKKKLKMYVIDNGQIEIKQLKENVDITIENTKNNTIAFIEEVLFLRRELNKKIANSIN